MKNAWVVADGQTSLAALTFSSAMTSVAPRASLIISTLYPSLPPPPAALAVPVAEAIAFVLATCLLCVLNRIDTHIQWSSGVVVADTCCDNRQKGDVYPTFCSGGAEGVFGSGTHYRFEGTCIRKSA